MDLEKEEEEWREYCRRKNKERQEEGKETQRGEKYQLFSLNPRFSSRIRDSFLAVLCFLESRGEFKRLFLRRLCLRADSHGHCVPLAVETGLTLCAHTVLVKMSQLEFHSSPLALSWPITAAVTGCWVATREAKAAGKQREGGREKERKERLGEGRRKKNSKENMGGRWRWWWWWWWWQRR